MSDRGAARIKKPRWISAWFALDAILALAPPLYWAMDGARTSFLGLPVVVLYFVGVSACIAASIVAAFIAEAGAGEIA